jgi:hypothetical protein
MRVGCGSATIGMFASQWRGLVDEVVVVDDHITGVVSEHQAGKVLGWEQTGIRIKGRRSTPGRYFRVSEPGLGWGGTRHLTDPLEILGDWQSEKGRAARPALLMVSTTGEQFAYYELDEALRPVRQDLPETAAPDGRADRGELRAGAVHRAVHGRRRRVAARRRHENPVRLTRSVQGGVTRLTSGGAPSLCLAGRRHHLHGRRDPPAATPSAMCRRPRWWRRSNSPWRVFEKEQDRGHGCAFLRVAAPLGTGG